MSIVFDPFTGQIIDTGATPGMAIGGPVAGADPHAVLVTDGDSKLSDIQLNGDGKILIGQNTGAPAAATIGGTTDQIIITNGPNSITLSLPQDIATTSIPEFAGMTLTAFSGPIKATAGILSASAIDLTSSEVSGILTVDKGGTGIDGSTAANGYILIGNGTGYTLASILGTTNQVTVTNGSGSIQLSLPQNIHSAASPTFANLNLGQLVSGSLETIIDISANTGPADTLNIGITNSDIINIGNAGAQVNIYGNTVYQNVTNLNVADKNITVNVGGSAGSSFNAGIHVEEDVLGTPTVVGYAEVNPLRDGWNFKAPIGNGVANLIPGNDGFTIENTTGLPYTINQGSHNPVTLGPSANGLLISDQELSMATADSSTTGALTSADWNTFNNKQDPIIFKVKAHKFGSFDLGPSSAIYIDGYSIENNDLISANLGFPDVSGIYKVTKTPLFAGLYAFSYTLFYTPSANDLVSIQNGTNFGGQIAKYNSTTNAFEINRSIRHYLQSNPDNTTFGGLNTEYWDQSAVFTMAGMNASSVGIFTINLTGSENMIMDYSIKRGLRKSLGTLYIISDYFGTSAKVSNVGVELNDPIGIEFDATISSGQITLNLISDSSGDDSEIKFILRRWGDGDSNPVPM